jgi:hypothetical protein
MACQRIKLRLKLGQCATRQIDILMRKNNDVCVGTLIERRIIRGTSR